MGVEKKWSSMRMYKQNVRYTMEFYCTNNANGKRPHCDHINTLLFPHHSSAQFYWFKLSSINFFLLSGRWWFWFYLSWLSFSTSFFFLNGHWSLIMQNFRTMQKVEFFFSTISVKSVLFLLNRINLIWIMDLTEDERLKTQSFSNKMCLFFFFSFFNSKEN